MTTELILFTTNDQPFTQVDEFQYKYINQKHLHAKNYFTEPSMSKELIGRWHIKYKNALEIELIKNNIKTL